MERTTENVKTIMQRERNHLREAFFDYQHEFFKVEGWMKGYCINMMKHYETCEQEVLNLMFRCGFVSLKDYLAGYDALYNERVRCEKTLR